MANSPWGNRETPEKGDRKRRILSELTSEEQRLGEKGAEGNQRQWDIRQTRRISVISRLGEHPVPLHTPAAHPTDS